ncbi:hypothetical protein ER308_14570 [Egibacter rhizosphaerae]|uniref:GerMN domain-containing protein n=1 Tax=Egibacter rhizosphaerae TaxID=1670831 RepID=A0A411YHR3_9ACTN|nr:Gmad2 immunoglobulin-like domain-containing protein [Egibacter rhizosphaerae]QBI20661.1 hypothetical protein ER308_14570 [Egibacter rhizosphaerae]
MRTLLRVALAGLLLLALAACSDAEDETTLEGEPDDSGEEEEPDPDDSDDADETDETDEEDEADEEPEEVDEEEAEDEADDEDVDAAEADEGNDGDGDGESQSVTTFALREIDGDYFVESVQTTTEPTEAVATASIEAMLDAEPADPGLTRPLESSPEVLGASIDDGVLTVNLTEEVRDGSPGGAAHEGAFAQALAHAGAQFDSVDAVSLQVEGDPIDELWGHLDWSEPIAPDPFMRADVDVETPNYGDTYATGSVLEVSGTSLTFESNVQFELRDPSGETVEESFTTADQPGMDQRGPFAHQMDRPLDEPGEWTLVVRSPDPSDGEADRAQYTAEIAVQVEE